MLHGKRVLVVEDEFLIALDVEQICAAAGASEVSIVRTLDAATDKSFDVAIVDVMLGNDSTVDFARSLSNRGVPFVFATGYTDLDGRFEEFNGVPVLDKPYGADALMQALSSVLSKAQQSPFRAAAASCRGGDPSVGEA